MTLLSGAAATVALLAVSALSGVSLPCRSWRRSCRAFLLGTIGPRLRRFADRELFVSLAPWRCRVTGRLVGRAPRLAGLAYRYFNVLILMGALSAAALVAVGLRPV